MGAFSLGQAAPSLQDFSVALGAAGFIYDTIDRVSDYMLFVFYNTTCLNVMICNMTCAYIIVCCVQYVLTQHMYILSIVLFRSQRSILSLLKD